ncbi:MAG: ATP-binding cassette domain-containing protein, partial [Alphaproteobacteria bacterium]|nr:ATP-binding cassette domain-containing protein [Alphaproteobacteria bacterium]
MTRALELHNVCVDRSGRRILDRIDWSLRRGAVAAVLGPNGSGTDVRELRRRVRIVDPAARFGVDPSLRARDVVLTGLFGSLALYRTPTSEQLDRADQVLGAVGLAGHATQRYAVLSTGEQRRCLLARALVEIPEILILDEPTAGLDVNAREHLLATIDQLHRMPDAPTVIT